MSLAGCQISPIDGNFQLQQSLEIFDENSADKIWFKKDKEIKVSPLMPIRVKGIQNFKYHELTSDSPFLDKHLKFKLFVVLPLIDITGPIFLYDYGVILSTFGLRLKFLNFCLHNKKF